MRNAAVLLLVVLLLVAASPKKKPAPPKPVAPETVTHSIALFLAQLSNEGARPVTFRAAAHGHRFYFEEPAGVTVYIWDKGGYKKERFVKATTLAKMLKK